MLYDEMDRFFSRIAEELTVSSDVVRDWASIEFLLIVDDPVSTTLLALRNQTTRDVFIETMAAYGIVLRFSARYGAGFLFSRL